MAPVARVGLLSSCLAACATGPALDPTFGDEIHAACRARIERGDTLTRRRRDVGVLPRGRAERTRVVIYGAGWCKACRIAADYLSQRRIPFVEYDIEADSSAQARMRATLDAARLTYKDVLPVIEVRHTVTYGFMPCVVEAAWSG